MNIKKFLQISAFWLLMICCCFVTACSTQSAVTTTDNANTAPIETISPTDSVENTPLSESVTKPTLIPGPDAVLCDMPSNTYDTLSVPTQITRIGDDFFLVDCYHNQILTSPSLDKPLTEWLVLTDNINRGHTIAGNGSIYVADDTENHRILVFTKYNDCFYQTQIIESIGNRPHYVEYNPITERFYVLSSMSSELYVFYQDPASLELHQEKVLEIPNMDGVYIRSFTFIDEYIYFATGIGIILRCDLDNLNVLEVWFLPNELAGLVQIVKIDDYFYLTVSTDNTGNTDYATIIRTKDLSLLENNQYEDLYTTFGGIGTPYYISSFDGHFFLTHHSYVPGNGVWQFEIADNELHDVKALYP